MVDDDVPKFNQVLTFAPQAPLAAKKNDVQRCSNNSQNTTNIPLLAMDMFLREGDLPSHESSHGHDGSQSLSAPPHREVEGMESRNAATTQPDPQRCDRLSEFISYGSNSTSTEEAVAMEEFWTRTTDVLPSLQYDGIQHFTITLLKFLVEEIRTTPLLQLLWSFVLVLSLLGGNVLQVIGLNFWLTKFPTDGAPGNYTIFAVSSLIFALFFIILLGIYVFIHAPDLSFAWEGCGLRLLVIAGALDALSSTLSIYSASQTPEILQTLFTAFVPVYTAVLVKWFLDDPRNYYNRWTLISFSLIVLGVLIASVSHLWAAAGTPTPVDHVEGLRGALQGPSSSDGGQIIWCVLFFLSVLPTVLLNITQTIYMKRYTEESNDSVDRSEVGQLEVFATPPPATPPPTTTLRGMAEVRVGPPGISLMPCRGDDTAVKLVMLAVDTTVQFLFALAFMPLDALPWFGGSHSVPQTWSNFVSGLGSLVSCPGNFQFCCVYSAGFVLMYGASSYLNQRSVTLCSMVSQLTSPTTAITLLLFPALNISGNAAPWYLSVLAVLLLSAGVLVYVVWDAQSNPNRAGLDRRLKMPLLRGGGEVHHEWQGAPSPSPVRTP